MDPYGFAGVSDRVSGLVGCKLVLSGGRDPIDEGGESN